MNRFKREPIENPCHMCMPMGALFPFKGVERAMVLIHGSQGCATYMRRHMSEHFHEPIDVASSAITENSTVYGGEASLIRGLDNLVQLYNPGLIGVITTCLAETIGEDIGRMCAAYTACRGGSVVPLIPVSTPGYGGSHHEGYWAAARALVSTLVRPHRRHRRLNVILPNISPADVREIRRLLEMMRIEHTLFPDCSDTLDAPFNDNYQKIPAGGTPLALIEQMGNAPATLELGGPQDISLSPGAYLENRSGVPCYRLDLPVGLQATDRFLDLLCALQERTLPDQIADERGRLQDAMVDSHKYNFNASLALIGEPHHVHALHNLCRENGLEAKLMATHQRSQTPAEEDLEPGVTSAGQGLLLTDTDYAEIRDRCRDLGVILAVGPSDARYLTEQQGIPLVRHGYPIHDRVGGQRLLSVGYTGSMLLLDRITNALLEAKHSHYRDDIRRCFGLSAGVPEPGQGVSA